MADDDAMEPDEEIIDVDVEEEPEEVDAELDPDELDEEELEAADEFEEIDDEFSETEDEEEEADDETDGPVRRSVSAEEDDDDDMLAPDDVEADLDTILKDRIASGDDDQDDEDEEEVAPEPGADAADRVVPRRADEFVCESCFLVKHASQRVGDGNLCRDCV